MRSRRAYVDETGPEVRRHLIATGVTVGLDESGGRVVESVSAMADLLMGEFGFTRVPGLGINPTKEEMEKGVRDFCGRCSPDDLLVIYHTGHGQLVGGRHRLWMGDATGDRLTGTLPTADLAELALTDTPLRHLLLIIDACFAGRGGAESLTAGMQAIGRSKDKTLTVISAAHPLEQVRAGDFAGLFEEAVHHRATAGHEPKYLLPEALTEYMQSSRNRKPWQTISWSILFGSPERQRFFPNPRHDSRLRGLDVLTQTMMREGKEREQDFRTHFLPRARGVDVPTETAWRFVGRHAALRDLSAWLGDGAAGSLRVVTGDPGSGKSAVLARLTVLSDPDWRAAVPLDGVPPDTVPPLRSVGAAVHARGRTRGQILAALAAAAGVHATTPGELLRGMRGAGLVALIDAVDEAVDPDHVVSWLLKPLIRDADAAGLRLLLGTRKHLVDRLGAAHGVLDLDAPEYADRVSLRDYAIRCLREAVPDSLFRDAPVEVAEPVAAAVADAAGRSFLVALIVSRTLAAGREIPDAANNAWRASLPGTAADAMDQDLEIRLGPGAERARELLLPLAYANGAGLPWAGTWAPLAAELSGHPYGDEDIVWLMRNAGAYVVEAEENGSSVYRLYHRSLAESLRRGRRDREINSAFVTYLENRVPELAPGHRDWTRAPAYVRAHLATHARSAGRFGRFVTDGLYLATANPAPVVAALMSSEGDAETATAAAYQRALHLLRDRPVAERLSYLELWALRLDAEELAAHIRNSPFTRPWRTQWAEWPVEYPHRVLSGHDDALSAVVVLEGAPPTAVTVGRDGRLCVWDLLTAEPLAVHELADAPLLAVDVAATPDGAGIICVVDRDFRLHRIDAGTWEVREPVTTTGPVRRWVAEQSSPQPLMLCGTLPDGRLVAFIGGRGSRPAVWDLRAGERIATLRGVGRGWSPVSFCELASGRPVLLMRQRSYWLEYQYWDLMTGRPLISPPRLPRSLNVDTEPGITYYRDSRQRPVAAKVIFPARRRTLLHPLSPTSPPRAEYWDLEQYPVPSVRHKESNISLRKSAKYKTPEVISRLYPDAEQVWAVPQDGPGKKVIERAASIESVRDLRVGFTNNGQALWARAWIDGKRVTVALSAHTDRITGVAAARAGDRLLVLTVSDDGSARLWDLTYIFRAPSATTAAEGSPVYRLAFGTLPDGERVVLSTGSAGALVRRMRDGGIRTVLADRRAEWTAAATLVRNGPGALSAVVFGADCKAHIWDAKSGSPIGVVGIDPLNWVGQAAETERSDGTIRLVTSGHGPNSLVWDLPGWTFRKVLRGHAGWSASVDSGRDERGRPVAVTAGTDGRVCVWDLRTLRRRRRLRSFRRWSSFRRPESMRLRAVRLLGFPLAAVLTEDGLLRLVNLRTGRYIAGADPRAHRLAATSLPSGAITLVTATYLGQIRVWQVGATRHRLIEVACVELEVPVHDLRLEPDGRLMLGTAHGLSCLWVALDGDEVRVTTSGTPAASPEG